MFFFSQILDNNLSLYNLHKTFPIIFRAIALKMKEKIDF